MPKFSVVIVNTNSGNLLAELIDSFRALSLKNDDFEFIVVDNGSGDGSLSRVGWGDLDKKIILNRHNYGYPKALNQGLKLSRGRYIALFNPDTRLLNNVFEPIERVMARDSSVGICGPAKYYPDGKAQLSCFSFPSVLRQFLLIVGFTDFLAGNRMLPKILSRIKFILPPSAKAFLVNFDGDKPRQVPWIGDASFIFKKEVIENVGLYDENFLIYAADEDFCLRARQAGYGICYVPEAKIIHYATWKRYGAKTSELIYAYFKDLDYFYRKHYRGIKRASLILLNRVDWLISYVFTPKIRPKMRCPICGFVSEARFIEYHALYRIYECRLCKGQFSFPLDITTEDYGDLYKGEFEGGISYESFVAIEPDKAIELYSGYPYIKLALRLMKGLKGSGRLLDIGCSQGAFCGIAKDMGFEVYGIEPSAEAAKYAKDRLGIENVVAGGFDDIPGDWRNFDIVTAFEVIEHVDKPDSLIIKAYELLKPGGYLLLSAPNNNSLEVMLGRRNRRDFPPHHMTRWRKETIRLLLKKAGFCNARAGNTAVNRLVIGNIFFPYLLDERGQLLGFPMPFKRKEISAAKKGFLLSWFWIIAQRAGDVSAFLLNLAFFNHGATLVALAQKPKEK